MTWIERARASLVASFASGVARDDAAGPGSNHFALVLWPDRRSDHAPQARQTSNVRAAGKSICFKRD